MRGAAEAKLGFYPIPDQMIPFIASYIAAPQGGRILDPCAGEGVAIGLLAEALGISKSSRYANELHDARAKACAEHAGHVLCCDALKSLQAARDMFQILYANPPFGDDGREEGGGRLEPKFFRRLVDDATIMQPLSIAIYVTPQRIMARPEVIEHLARSFDDITLVRHPDHLREYNEVVMIGVIRATPRFGQERKQEALRLAEILEGELPIIQQLAEPRYIVPAPSRIKKLIFRDASRGTPAMAQIDVIKGGGAFRSKKYRAAAEVKDIRLQPVFPLHKPQAVLRIAAGEINGQTVQIGGVPQVIKGSTKLEVIESSENFQDGDKDVTEVRRKHRRVAHIVTMDEDGNIRRFVGDKGMAALMGNEGTAEALLEAVEQTAPPRYRLDMGQDVADIVDTLIPVSGRHLPGYEPGLLAMQKHAVAAAHRALTTPDAGWDGQVPKATILAAEMGTGKTSMGIALAEVLRQLAPTNH